MSTPAKPVSVQPATTTPSQINEETLLEKDELIVKTVRTNFVLNILCISVKLTF